MCEKVPRSREVDILRKINTNLEGDWKPSIALTIFISVFSY